MQHDVIVVGGGFAGLAAAMQLARARRRVLVIDAGAPRNRFAQAVHGVLGHDGRPPRDVFDDAARQLANYPSTAHMTGEAVDAERIDAGFRVALADGHTVTGRRIILATGLRDELPPIPGMEARWGATVLHCPYCHGFEVADAPLGVIANHELGAHQASLMPDWGPTTYFTQGVYEPDAHHAEQLARRNVTIERVPVVALLGEAPALEGVRLADGRVVPLRAVFIASRTFMASPLAERLGCDFEDSALGPYISIDKRMETSVPGVYAAGDAASREHNASLATAAGVVAGVAVHHALVRDCV